jgi:hypothetical protein
MGTEDRSFSEHSTATDSEWKNEVMISEILEWLIWAGADSLTICTFLNEEKAQ